MKAPDKIFLFDIDSVLVEPLGYRAALMATLQRLIRHIGFDEDLLPDIDTIEYFEAMHITSEWDMAPIILAILLESLAQATPDLRLPSAISDLQTTSQARSIKKIDYRKTVEILSDHLVNGEYPAATALRISGNCSSKYGGSHLGLFPHIAGSSLLKDLLSNTRDPYLSATTRYFQHYSLGSQVYSKVYGIPPVFESTSMLESCDKPLLNPGLRDEILSRYMHGDLGVAAITNRPSYPPREVTNTLLGYAPEAEMALDLNGLSQIPLIGFGRLRYVAEQHGLETEALLKPSPVHVIAAIMAAITEDELESIQNAVQLRELHSDNETTEILHEPLQLFRKLPAKLHIHIFEDTRWGIEAAYQAGKMLKSAGIPNKIHAWGIANNPQKVKSLEQLGAIVYSNVSDALRDSNTFMNKGNPV
jgi:hypothetical protein